MIFLLAYSRISPSGYYSAHNQDISNQDLRGTRALIDGFQHTVPCSHINAISYARGIQCCFRSLTLSTCCPCSIWHPKVWLEDSEWYSEKLRHTIFSILGRLCFPVFLMLDYALQWCSPMNSSAIRKAGVHCRFTHVQTGVHKESVWQLSNV